MRFFEGQALSVKLFLRGINDTYIAEKAEGDRYSVKLSRANWRAKQHLANEAAFLQHLANNNAPVCAPVRNCDGEFIESVKAPEGARHILVTQWANGTNFRNAASRKGAYAAGLALSDYHSASQSFTWPVRQTLSVVEDISQHEVDLRTLIDRVPQHTDIVERAINEVREKLPTIVLKLPWRACHGDVHPGNMILGQNRQVTLIDFDVCGQWPHCFDIASFLWSLVLFRWPETHWQAFLTAYQQKKTLSDFERKQIPFFCLVRDVWHLITWARNADALGLHWFQNERIADRVEVTRRLVEFESLSDLSRLELAAA